MMRKYPWGYAKNCPASKTSAGVLSDRELVAYLGFYPEVLRDDQGWDLL